MTFPSRLAVLGLCAAVFTLAAQAPLLARSKEPVISRITIHGTDIFDFDTNPYLKKWPYTWINILHFQTKQRVIERELLFNVGEPVDDYLLEETARNLRALSFIQAARVAKFPQRDGTVAVVVYVSDSWTTEPQFNLGGQNKVDEIEIGFKEKNFLGLGKSVQYLHSKSPGKVEQTFRYTDPRVWGTRWQMEAETVEKTGGRERNFIIRHPYFAADTRWAADGAYRQNVEVLGDFVNNVRVSEYEQTYEVGEVGASVKVGRGRRIVNHVGTRFRDENTRFSATEKSDPAIPIPSHRGFKTIFLEMDTQRNKFITITQIEKMTRVEDFNLGPRFAIAPGFSPRALTGEKDTKTLSTTYEQKIMIDGLHLFMGKLDFSGREVFDQAENLKVSADARYYHRGFHRQTLVVHSRFDWGRELDPGSRIILGADNGLRSYTVDQFVGDRSVVFNLEDRFYFIDDFLSLVSVGAAAFYEVGSTWSRGRPASLSDLRNSVGCGLRLGLTKSSNEVIVRIDVAYRMERVATDKDRFVVTFGTGQAF